MCNVWYGCVFKIVVLSMWGNAKGNGVNLQSVVVEFESPPRLGLLIVGGAFGEF